MTTILLYLVAAGLTVVNSALGKSLKKEDSTLFLNFSKMAVLFVFYGIRFLIAGGINTETAIMGVSYGALWAVSCEAGVYALTIGIMALSSIISSFSLIIPVLYGILFLHEQLSAVGILGLVLVFVSFVVINSYSVIHGERKGFSFKWLILILLTMVTNGVCSTVQKIHQIHNPGEFRIAFMFTASFVAFVIFVLICLVKKPKFSKGALVKGGLSGIANGLALEITLVLAQSEPAYILFPVISVLTMTGSLVVGNTVFKEKLKINEIIGFLIGLAAIVLLNGRR